MKRIPLHWLIIVGVLVGAVSGTALYLQHREEARIAVLGTGYSHAQLIEQSGEINEKLLEILKPNAIYQAFDGLATIFLKLLKMIVIPLVFFSLCSGMAALGDVTKLGRIGLRTFAWYISTSFIAIFTGLLMVNLLKPGVGTSLTVPEATITKELPESVWDVITNMVPSNIVAAANNFELIGVIIFTVMFGIFLLTIEEEKKKKAMTTFIDAGAEIMMKMTHFIISLAPVGIAALIARMVSTTGPSVFISMGWYMVTVFAALGTHMFITLPVIVYALTRRNAYRYLQAMTPALLTAFSTASSSGTLAVTMERTEKGAGVSNRVASFVLPLGATVNMDGTALYEIVTVLFIAQVHAGIDPNFSLTIGQQLQICFLGLMVSIGAAGIPHAGLVMMVIILESVGLPVAYTGLIWAVDRVLDMCRTSTNVWSDSCVALVVADKEGDIDETILFAPPP